MSHAGILTFATTSVSVLDAVQYHLRGVAATAVAASTVNRMIERRAAFTVNRDTLTSGPDRQVTDELLGSGSRRFARRDATGVEARKLVVQRWHDELLAALDEQGKLC